MVDYNVCAVPGCRIKKRETDFSFHALPKSSAERQQWIDVLGIKEFKKETFVCSQHFSADCFTNWQEKQMGFASKLRLKPGSVPSIQVPSSGPSASVQWVPMNTQNPFVQTTADVGCQWEPQKWGRATVATQLSVNTLKHFRSKAVQVHVCTCSVGTNPDGTVEFEDEAWFRPLKRNRFEDLLSDTEDQDSAEEESAYHPSMSTFSDSTTDRDRVYFEEGSVMGSPHEVEQDVSLSPGEPSEHEEEVNEEAASCLVESENRAEDDGEFSRSLSVGDGLYLVDLGSSSEFVVDEERLLELFKSCLHCHRRCQVKTRTHGLKVVINQTCAFCSNRFSWTNLPDDFGDDKEPLHGGRTPTNSSTS